MNNPQKWIIADVNQMKKIWMNFSSTYGNKEE